MESPFRVDAARHVYTVGSALWSSVLIGGAPPAIEELRERMSRPRPGDLVIEVSSFRGFDPDGVGTLLRIEGDDPSCPDGWVIEPLGRPGEEQGWGNAQFVALPTDSAARWASAVPEQEAER